jgi:NADH:ubiquinone oxidoreductase subunit F (NADH-binding)
MTAPARPRSAPPSGVARLLAGADGPPTLERHLALYGPLEHPADIVRLTADAALRGRGGGAFATARKLAAVAAQPGRPIVVANGAEGEPASKKDRSLLRVAPHLVLDGAVVAARAVGAREAIVAVSRPAPELEAAIGERGRRRVDPVQLSVRRVPDRFVAGEETALLQALEGREPKPTLKPPFPFERGLGTLPTLVQNVETLAHLALVARYGPAWFGTGTALVTLGGAVARPGVHEVPLGATLAEVVARCGGTAAPVAGYLVGGYFGGWVAPGAAADLRLTPDVLGAGAILALPASTCAAAECARVVRYLSDESAGQCGPCVHGLAAIAGALAVDRRGDRRADVRRWADMVEARGACRHPDGAAHFVRTALDVFADEFARHAKHRGCGRPYEGVLPVGGPA